MEKIINFLATLTLTLTVLLGFNIVLSYFSLDLGLENKYLICPLLFTTGLLFFYSFGRLIISFPKTIAKINKLIYQLSKKIIKFISNLIKFAWVKYGLIPILLFIGGLLTSTAILILGGEMRSVIIRKHPDQNFVNYEADTFTRGDVAAAVFEAKNNNLGTIGVKFETYNRINDDVLEFRLKEEGSNQWIYRNEYKTDQFQNNQFFSFGFPVIKNSAGKNYLFEIESLVGNSENAVGLSKRGRVIESRYKFDLQNLKKDRGLMARFIFTKLTLALDTYSFWLASLVYLTPFLGYLAFLIFEDKFRKVFSTIEDYFSLSLMVYLVVEIIVQMLRLGNEYNWWSAEPNGNLKTTSNVLLIITISLGIIVALLKEGEPVDH